MASCYESQLTAGNEAFKLAPRASACPGWLSKRRGGLHGRRKFQFPAANFFGRYNKLSNSLLPSAVDVLKRHSPMHPVVHLVHAFQSVLYWDVIVNMFPVQ